MKRRAKCIELPQRCFFPSTQRQQVGLCRTRCGYKNNSKSFRRMTGRASSPMSSMQPPATMPQRLVALNNTLVCNTGQRWVHTVNARCMPSSRSGRRGPRQVPRVRYHLVATDPHEALIATVKQHRRQRCRTRPPMDLLHAKETNMSFIHQVRIHVLGGWLKCPAPTCTIRSKGRPKSNRVIDNLDVGISANRGRTSQHQRRRRIQCINLHQTKGVGVSVKKHTQTSGHEGRHHHPSSLQRSLHRSTQHQHPDMPPTQTDRASPDATQATRTVLLASTRTKAGMRQMLSAASASTISCPCRVTRESIKRNTCMPPKKLPKYVNAMFT